MFFFYEYTVSDCKNCCYCCLVAKLCLTLCDPMDCSSPDSSVHGFSRQEHWSRQPFPSPEHFPDLGIEPGSLALQADSLPSEPTGIKSMSMKKGDIYIYFPIHIIFQGYDLHVKQSIQESDLGNKKTIFLFFCPVEGKQMHR